MLFYRVGHRNFLPGWDDLWGELEGLYCVVAADSRSSRSLPLLGFETTGKLSLFLSF